MSGKTGDHKPGKTISETSLKKVSVKKGRQTDGVDLEAGSAPAVSNICFAANGA